MTPEIEAFLPGYKAAHEGMRQAVVKFLMLKAEWLRLRTEDPEDDEAWEEDWPETSDLIVTEFAIAGGAQHTDPENQKSYILTASNEVNGIPYWRFSGLMQAAMDL